ncbi:3'(2'),5'-bisphosphate nucleotidase [hydrothermal vent metagenome]|uniref:3'-phosphoadenosine 5'-phosphate phosphatase n=1 Tax=hydrothermal vent metagenome TaxID=652676 RepID=A0A3B0Z732_9ZZZZ
MEKYLKLLAPVLRIAEQAAVAISDIYHKEYSIIKKIDHSPLTDADLASHQIIEEGLLALTPELPLISEEGTEPPFDERQQWQSYWLVDPLDGTREFINKTDEFVINIALINNNKPVLGVIHVPVTGVVYYAVQGYGAFKKNKGKEPEKIRSKVWDGGKIRIVASSRASNIHYQNLKKCLNDSETIIMGAALKSCLVAEGAADLYVRYGETSEWDTAAAQIIVDESGGALMALDGLPLQYNRTSSLLNESFIVVGDRHHDWLSLIPCDKI